MILARTPLRVPLAGGLSDLKPYAARFGGETVSATIDKYAWVSAKDAAEGIFDVRWGDVHERTPAAGELRHELLREALGLAGLEGRPLDVDLRVDLAGESGLGTSGALTVGILHALRRLQGRRPDPWELLHDAARVEVERLEGASGFHDPAVCALGGLRHLAYDGRGVEARPLAASRAFLEALDASLLLFYSGRHARSKPSLDLLTHRLEEGLPVLHDIRALAGEAAAAIAGEDLAGVARAIGEQQRLKARLPGRFHDPFVASVTERVAATGAAAQLPGGKISAYVLVCCPQGQHDAVRAALPELREVPFRLESEGTRAVEL